MRRFKPYLFCTGIIFSGLLAASLIDIVLAALMPRFYTTAAFVLIFGVVGIIATLLSYITVTEYGEKQGMQLKWPIIIFHLIIGILLFFLIARLEGGEYKIAFQSYGITTAFSSFLFAKNVEKK